MELIDKILREWAYRVHDGMPNLKNPLHLVQLKETLNELRLPRKVTEKLLNNLRKVKEDRVKKFSKSAGRNVSIDPDGKTFKKNPDNYTDPETGKGTKTKSKEDPPSKKQPTQQKEKPKLTQKQNDISNDLSNGNIDELKKSHMEILRKRFLGMAGMGGPSASYAESIFTDQVNTLPEYSELYTDDKNDILKLEENIKIFKQKQQILTKKGKPSFPKPNTEESEMFEIFGWDKENPPPEAYEYFAKRELFAQKKLEEVKNDPDSVFYKKGRQGFNGDDEAFKEWMRTVFDGSMATKEEIENNSNIDTSKPHMVLQSEDGVDSHDNAIKDHLLSEYEKHKIRCERGETKSCEDADHYKRQHQLMDKFEFSDTFALGQDTEGRTTIYHISNKKASNITDPHNNTTPAKRIQVMQEAGFGEETSKTVGKVLQQGFDDVSDVKKATIRNVKDVDITDDLALLADVLNSDNSSYMDNCVTDKKFNAWATQNNISLGTTKEKLIAIKKYITASQAQGINPPYKFGKIFAKLGEIGLKKKTQKENPNIDFSDSGINQANNIKETEKNMVKSTYKKIVNSIEEADKRRGFPDEKGNNGPHTQGYITTVMDSMHIGLYIDNYDGDAGIAMGGRVAQPRDMRECLAELTGFKGDISTSEGRKQLKEWIRKRCKIDSEYGGVVTKGPKGDIKLFKDEWRSAGSDTQKVASYYGESMQNCMKSKIDIRRQKNTGIGK